MNVLWRHFFTMLEPGKIEAALLGQLYEGRTLLKSAKVTITTVQLSSPFL